MAAAYTAVVSLINTLDNINNHPRFSTSFDEEQIKSLGDNLDFFLEFVENCNSYGDISKIYVEDLESRIASAAHAAEDLIESHIADQLLAEYSVLYSSDMTGSSCLPLVFYKKRKKQKALKAGEMNNLSRVKLHLQKILKKMDAIKGKVKKVIKKARRTLEVKDSSIAEASSSRFPTNRKTSMVGFDAYLHQLLDWLTGQQSDRKVIPITGMGGIGKTTLARNAYENLLTVQYFDIRAWVTISQEYSAKRILVEILSCLGILSFSENEGEHVLGEKLHKTLAGRRYLITLDDMWSVEVWDEVKFFFPDHHNSSRIIVTSRISSVANYFGSLSLALDLLDGDQSWNLFCESVFGKEVVCPPELEEIGWNIAKKCSGLPLSIVVVGGLLRKSPRVLGYWEYVANDLSSILYSGENSECLEVVSFSYNHLPMCLKPCFLYLGVFPEDYNIPVSRLIRLWVSEGFVKPDKLRSLEQVAEGYIKDLIDRNLLVLVHDFEGTSKSCMIHDLVRDYCIKVSQKEKIFHILRDSDPARTKTRRVVVRTHIYGIYASRKLFTRSIICKHESYHKLESSLRLLRVMEGVDCGVDILFQQFNLRFISCEFLRRFSSSVSLFWNLQTLYIRGFGVKLPSEIWKMRQIRHIECAGISFISPPPSGTVLPNLQTLKRIYGFSFSEEACKTMPGMKDLDIGHKAWMLNHCQYNLVGLAKVESLCLSDYVVDRDRLAQNLSFPLSLRNLTLSGCRIQCEDLTMIGSLPHLEVLILLEDGVVGPEWNPVDGEFLRLKLLKIHKCAGLIRWQADSSHFPVLEKLVLDDSELNEIPLGIGEIPTLEHVRVIDGSCSLAVSAARLLEQRQSFGDDGLHVQIEFYSVMIYDEFKELVEQEVLTSLNLKLLSDFYLSCTSSASED